METLKNYLLRGQKRERARGKKETLKNLKRVSSRESRRGMLNVK